MNTTDVAVVTVTQADRDIAADILAGPPWSHDRMAAIVRAGRYDSHGLVRAAAMSRLAQSPVASDATTDGDPGYGHASFRDTDASKTLVGEGVEPAYMEWPALNAMLHERLTNDDDERGDHDLVATRAEVCALLTWARLFDRQAQPRRDEEQKSYDIISRAAALLDATPPADTKASIPTFGKGEASTFDLSMHDDQPFIDAWAGMARRGYVYGEDALEDVHLGWQLALATPPFADRATSDDPDWQSTLFDILDALKGLIPSVSAGFARGTGGVDAEFIIDQINAASATSGPGRDAVARWEVYVREALAEARTVNKADNSASTPMHRIERLLMSALALTPAGARTDALEALSQLVAFVSIMVGVGPDCRIPETIDTPIGAPVKIGEIMRDARAALSAGERDHV